MGVPFLLGSVILATSDKARLIRFYHDILEVPFGPDGKLRSGGIILHPALHDQIQGPPVEPYRIMLTFETSDIHAVAARLTARGVTFVRPPEREFWGGWIATFTDPDGNYLQLLQPAP